MQSKANQEILELLVEELKRQLPALYGIYLFGTFDTEYERSDSDIDLAVLGIRECSVVDLWDLAQKLSGLCHRDVDLINLDKASTVFCFQILSEARRLYAADSTRCDFFEVQAISRFYYFDFARKEILEDFLKGRKDAWRCFAK